jgi:predicted lipid-binding transport protein (Tim44 family)
MMGRMRRPLVALAVLLMAPADALARAGGGSSGYGGGGGGGGGGGYSGGGGSGSGDGSWFGLAIWVVIIAVFFLVGAVSAWRLRRRRRKRVRRVITVSAEAATDDAWFGAEAVQKDAAELFRQVQAAWDAGDRERLAQMVGDDLMVEWRRRLDDFDQKGWHNRVEVRKGPEVEYVGIVNREDDNEDRVCVRLSGSLFDVVETKQTKVLILRKDAGSEVSEFGEYWTLARRGDRWMVVSIEQDAEGLHNLEEPLVPTPWSDQQRLHDEAVVEQAQADAPEENVASLFSVEFADDARKAALDLSLIDDRYAPDVLEVAARRAVAAWAEAVDGDDAALTAIAEPDAVQELLYGGDSSGKTRLVVRGPRVEEVRILELDSAANPPAFTVEAHIRGRRYVEDRDTVAVVSGDPNSETTFTQRWRLVLSGTSGEPWRVGVTEPAARAY